MAKNRALTLSLVIPVYNEQHHLRACLESVKNQTLLPDEVIVVDNNSTDASVEIAKGYPFVTIIKEPRQGRSHARSAGFDAAKGDILGRIDADSLLAPDWVARIKTDFAAQDIAGVTGLGRTNIFPWVESVYVVFWSRIYYWCAHSLFRYITMWGANMAIKRDYWLKVRQHVSFDETIVHEDQDLSLLITGAGGQIIQDNKLLVTTKGQTYFYWPKFYNYALRTFLTFRLHRQDESLKKHKELKLGLLRLLPGASVGWLMTSLFSVGSFLGWPITALQRRLGK